MNATLEQTRRIWLCDSSATVGRVRMKTIIAVIAGVAIIAGCGGGSGGVTTQTLPPLTPGPLASANVAGTVLDEMVNGNLMAGVQISLAPWAPGAIPMPITTSTPNGLILFSVPPGSYMLVVGSNSPSDSYATLHMGIVLVAGNNSLTLPVPPSIPNVTYTYAQMGGNIRLMRLSLAEQSCLSGANAGRVANGLPPLIPDEFLEEDALAFNQEQDAQATESPSPLSASTEPFGTPSAAITSTGFNPCSSWSDAFSFTAGNPPFVDAENYNNVWYGAVVDEANSPNYGVQLWSTNTLGVGPATKVFRMGS